MTFNSYYTKLARGEWETVLGVHRTKELAQEHADKLNTWYQTDEYYVEAHDEEKFNRENPPLEEVMESFSKWQEENSQVDKNPRKVVD